MPDTTMSSKAKTANETKAELLFFHAQTSLHPGSGTTLGVVDLPVQRERHTQWPTIPGSGIKGVLREACRRRLNAGRPHEADADPELTAAFGPPTSRADEHAGALTVTDARILAFPVRSLRGIFAWVTCAAALQRLNRDLSLVNRDSLKTIPTPDKEKAACTAGSPLLVEGDRLVLEEFEFTRSEDAEAVAQWIGSNAITDEATRARLRDHLVVLHDDDFTYFVRHATEVVARIGLDYERKTVRSGALFYQEFLPAETLLYALVLASPSRKENDAKDAAAILRYLRDNLPAVLQIGGDETIGKGLCTVRLTDGKGGGT